jgi:hypothetical protein
MDADDDVKFVQPSPRKRFVKLHGKLNEMKVTFSKREAIPLCFYCCIIGTTSILIGVCGQEALKTEVVPFDTKKKNLSYACDCTILLLGRTLEVGLIGKFRYSHSESNRGCVRKMV